MSIDVHQNRNENDGDKSDESVSIESEHKMKLQDENVSKSNPTSLTQKQRQDILFLVLAFSCVVATLTIVVGTGAVVILSVGGSASLAPFALAMVFIGMSSVSLLLTHWIFIRWGRKLGFWIGCLLGIIGVLIGCWGLFQSSAGIVLVAQMLMGLGLGIGMFLRFSAVEVVPHNYSAKAVAWVLAGGCFAAFLGPEMSQATNGIFGDDTNLTFLGTFIVAGGFFMLQALFVGLVGFPTIDVHMTVTSVEMRSPTKEGDQDESCDIEEEIIKSSLEEKSNNDSKGNNTNDDVKLSAIILQPSFLLPLGIATLSWICMAMPMSIFRVTMKGLGYTDRQSLTVIEFHFLTMYGPGFISGSLIKQRGVVWASKVGLVCFVIALSIFLSIQDNNNTTAGWFIGFMILGFGWNFSFSSATVWSTKSYAHYAPHLKSKAQAVNDCLMFLCSGGAVFSTGYLYEDAGGGGIDGWRLLNACLYGVLVLYATLLWFSKERS